MAVRSATPAVKRQPGTKKSRPAARPRHPRLPKKVRLALDDFQSRVLELFPKDIRQIILYGSYARGDWRDESDVDVLVVANWKEGRLPNGRYLAWFGDPRWEQIVDSASDVLIERGVYISPLVMGEVRYEARKDGVLRDIEREGQTLWKNRQT